MFPLLHLPCPLFFYLIRSRHLSVHLLYHALISRFISLCQYSFSISIPLSLYHSIPLSSYLLYSPSQHSSSSASSYPTFISCASIRWIVMKTRHKLKENARIFLGFSIHWSNKCQKISQQYIKIAINLFNILILFNYCLID